MFKAMLEKTGDTGKIWQEFWKLGEARTNAPGIRARVMLMKPEAPNCRQFLVETGSGHNFVVDDPAGGTGPKPIELVAAALAGCTAFDVITILRSKKRHSSQAMRSKWRPNKPNARRRFLLPYGYIIL